ncbi:universal stress protein [Nocardiopsis dassonvillei]|uniref:universal stress protein n=1 Tax=Nocardiopsis dassonvillei TaxID=2014 RepID=UPI0008FC6F01|nr:universal stress protein [Nocardiopsis dassonvillei]APC34865.1 universal stress family protein [Nocardiopsis dassonvillei]
MRENILVGTDGSKNALVAAEWAVQEARRRGGTVTVLGVYDADVVLKLVMRPSDLLEREAHRAVRATVEHVRAGASDVKVVPRTSPAASSVQGLLRHSESASMLVVGAHGVSALLGTRLGSVADQVAAHARVPVVVVGPEPVPEDAREVVVGVDGSTGSRSAVSAALESASAGDGPVRAVWAWSAPTDMVPYRSDSEEELRRWHIQELEGALEPVLARHPDTEVVREAPRDHPVRALLARTRNARLFVVGARGGRGFAQLALGGVARGVLYRSERPVMVVHRSQD